MAESAMRGPELSPDVVQALKGKLVADGFDLTAPIHVHELPSGPGFLLTQYTLRDSAIRLW